MNKSISALLDYAERNGLIKPFDRDYCANRILNLIGEALFEYEKYEPYSTIDDILSPLIDIAVKNGKLEQNTNTFRDIVAADIMDVVTPKPSEVIEKFRDEYEKNGAKSATDYFYNLSKADNYIMTERIKKNIKWESKTRYGNLIITVNLSKPEKDPKDIAAAKLQKQSGYPKCLLCVENVGYEGNVSHPPRANHRTIPLTLDSECWHLQYSPYVYYNEHCIVLDSQHTPMKLTKSTFKKLLDFVTMFPHYFVGSNADLPIVGGSILTHNHFQGGNAQFPMALCHARKKVEIKGFEDVDAEIVDWALSTIRIRSENKERLVELADKILNSWRNYDDEENEIISYSENEPHNTITPIARKRGEAFELDLILRNNRTSIEHPLGIFHPHKEYHHIKKENIGLIEAMGLAVLPPRLVNEFNLDDESVRNEIGDIFSKILENCAVFKDTEKGNEGFLKFIYNM
ncbi:MAG: UDP-glucose--hexose-1-phosphate uridylyltransferase [Clostridiales bacterium]|nr:UDP-glucose--hexose-1-phosphate uridylyltransferase [Clostridiales bacterium]